MEFYVFQTEAEANACIFGINASGVFPIAGKTNGVSVLGKTQTTCWVKKARELPATGEWAIPRIPESRLDYIGVPEENRDAFLSVFGQDIRSLSYSDFTTVDYITP